MKHLSRWSWAVAALMCLMVGASADAGTGSGIERLWVSPVSDGWYVSEQVVQDGQPVVQITFHQGTTHVPLSPLAGRARSIASLGDALYLAFDNGALVRNAGPYPQVILRSLPESMTPVSVFADVDRNRLYVLARQVKDASGAASTQRATSKPTTERADAKLQECWQVFEWVSGEWLPTATLPREFDGNSEPAAAAYDGGIDAFGFKDKAQARHWRFKEGKWTEQASVALKGDVKRLWPVVVKGSPVLVVSAVSGNGETLTIRRLAMKGKERGPILLKAKDKDLVVRSPYNVTSDDANIVVGYWSKDEGKIRLSRWSMDGKSVDATVLDRTSGKTGQPQDHSTLLTMLMILMLLGVLFTRGLTSADVAVDPPAGWVFSPFWRRGAAFLVDFVMIAMAFSVFLAIVQPDELVEVMKQHHLTQSFDPSRIDPRMIKYGLLNVAIFVIYCIAMESQWGWTLGKRFFMLEVRQSENMNERPTWRQIATRNIAKMLELYMLPLLIMMALTRNRQRVGDMLGRTVVLQKGRENPSSENRPNGV